MGKREAHQIYLADYVWIALRKHVLDMPGSDASQVMEYLIGQWIQSGQELNVPDRHASGHRVDRGIMDKAGRHTIYLRPGLWEVIEQRAAEGGYSVSMLIEQLLRNYMGV